MRKITDNIFVFSSFFITPLSHVSEISRRVSRVLQSFYYRNLELRLLKNLKLDKRKLSIPKLRVESLKVQILNYLVKSLISRTIGTLKFFVTKNFRISRLKETWNS